MSMNQEIINQGLGIMATTGAKKLINDVIDIYLKPKLMEMKDRIKTGEIESFSKDFTEYIERSYKKNLNMSTIVFRNQQKTVDDLYIPLTVKKCQSMGDKDSIEFYIDEYKDEFIPKYKKILIVDSAGMGKSTLMKFLYLKSIIQNKGIPILIELRKLNKETSILDFIKNEIDGISVHFKREEIIELIERGDFIFFFDGYDEINQDSKKMITDNIQDFISKAGNNSFIISSRDEHELNSFGDFQRFDIKRLKKEEVYNLIYKYDKNGELSKELVQKLETENNLKLISEFLDNPLMVSLLYKAFEYKKTIPYKKHIFYRQVYDALFEEHDMSKGGAYVHSKKSKLDIEDFHKVMRHIAFNTLSKGIIYQKENFIEIINKAKEKVFGVDFKASDLIYDLTHAVPIFKKEGNEYRWIHKSFQDYFAACYICFDAKKNTEAILKKISQEDRINRYYNILDFCYDIDYSSFNTNIIYPILTEFKSHIEKIYTEDFYNKYNRDDLYDRKEILFRYKDIFIKKLNEDEKKFLIKQLVDDENFDQFDYFFPNDFASKFNVGTIINREIGIMLNEKNNIKILLELLENKNSTIVREIPIDRTFEKLKVLESGAFILNDDINNKLNDISIFKYVNNLLIQTISSRRRTLKTIGFNYNNCMKLKTEIETEIRNDESEFDFL